MIDQYQIDVVRTKGTAVEVARIRKLEKNSEQEHEDSTEEEKQVL